MSGHELGKFLKLLAHDLQNQLGAIDMNLQVIPDLADENDETMKMIEPFVARASLASKEMIETLTDLQAFASLVSKKEADNGGVSKPPSTEFDLGRAVEDCGLLLAAAAKSRELTLTTKTEASVVALANPDDVRRTIKILSTELLRTSFPGSVITIEAVMAGDHPVVEFRSTQEGLFDSNRQTLALYLATRMLENSAATFEFPPNNHGPSILRLVFQAI